MRGDFKASSQFYVRAVTHDPSKGSAKSLAPLGAEVVTVRLSHQFFLDFSADF